MPKKETSKFEKVAPFSPIIAALIITGGQIFIHSQEQGTTMPDGWVIAGWIAVAALVIASILVFAYPHIKPIELPEPPSVTDILNNTGSNSSAGGGDFDWIYSSDVYTFDNVHNLDRKNESTFVAKREGGSFIIPVSYNWTGRTEASPPFVYHVSDGRDWQVLGPPAPKGSKLISVTVLESCVNKGDEVTVKYKQALPGAHGTFGKDDGMKPRITQKFSQPTDYKVTITFCEEWKPKKGSVYAKIRNYSDTTDLVNVKLTPVDDDEDELTYFYMFSKEELEKNKNLLNGYVAGITWIWTKCKCKDCEGTKSTTTTVRSRSTSPQQTISVFQLDNTVNSQQATIHS